MVLVDHCGLQMVAEMVACVMSGLVAPGVTVGSGYRELGPTRGPAWPGGTTTWAPWWPADASEGAPTTTAAATAPATTRWEIERFMNHIITEGRSAAPPSRSGAGLR